jgi:hypothetical protein
MTKLDQKQGWRARVGWLAGQLLVIFLGVTAAFVVENYRETASQQQELQQAIAGSSANWNIMKCAQASMPMHLIWPCNAGLLPMRKAVALSQVTTESREGRVRPLRRGTRRSVLALLE